MPAHYINIGCISLRNRPLLDEVCLDIDPCKSWPKIDNMSEIAIWVWEAGDCLGDFPALYMLNQGKYQGFIRT